jgi:hypothetical protein
MRLSFASEFVSRSAQQYALRGDYGCSKYAPTGTRCTCPGQVNLGYTKITAPQMARLAPGRFGQGSWSLRGRKSSRLS